MRQRVRCFWFKSGTPTDTVGSNVRQITLLADQQAVTTMGSQRFNCESGRRQLPSDLDPGEEELIEAFDQWIHTAHSNHTREGCPHRSVLRSFVFGTNKTKDESVFDHIGHCAACLDDMQQIRRELSAKYSAAE